jgi:hypothetical protein
MLFTIYDGKYIKAEETISISSLEEIIVSANSLAQKYKPCQNGRVVLVLKAVPPQSPQDVGYY